MNIFMSTLNISKANVKDKVYARIALFIVFVLFSLSLLLMLSKSQVNAHETSEIEALTLVWEDVHNGCENEIEPEIKKNKCNAEHRLSAALEKLGFCEGAHTLKYDGFKNQDNPKYRSQYELFEVLVREKWFPCIYSDIIKDKSKAINTDEISKNPIWIENSQDGSVKYNVNKMIYQYVAYDVNCRGGSGDKKETWDNCNKREKLYSYILDIGLCHAEYNYPESMKDVGIPYVWPFRRKWVPCHYYSLTDFDYKSEWD